MEGGIIRNNNATSDGGGVWVDGNNGVFRMTGGEIINNQGRRGGGLWINAGARVTIENGTIGNNTALESGGGIFTEDFRYSSILTPASGVYSNLTIGAGALFSGNKATNWSLTPIVQSGANN
jgi:predicted outer membrane repeat protein